MQERRKFERVQLPDSAKVYAEDTEGKRLGPVRMIGRGGLLIEVPNGLPAGTHREIVIVDPSEGIRREVAIVVRYSSPEGVGCEFHHLEPDAAVEIGVIIGKYYSAQK